ncbi:DDE family endonuclease [Ceratobasidium sp. AG-Ba]|nr:DDE family endonuclease [Ceratobasidium sp. AG-Ba]QRW08734.1 DDE family endonuclease [Ceratobasidium sp. AG-Ba]
MPYSAKRKAKIAAAERATEALSIQFQHKTPSPIPSSSDIQPASGLPLSENPEVHSLDLEEPPLGEQRDSTEDGSSSESSSEIETELTSRQIHHHPPTENKARAALGVLDATIRTRRRTSQGFTYVELDRVTLVRCMAMIACLSLYLEYESNTFIDASLRAAKGQRRGTTYARSIRQWIRQLIKSGDIPLNCWGWWNVSSLEDEDVSNKIKLHLQRVGKYARAQDVVEFLSDPERWLSRSGFWWRAEPKAQYFDGHEQNDVVAYRQNIFVPFCKAVERQRVIYREDGLPIAEQQLVVLEGEKPIIFWFHDKSIFYANDRQQVRWVYIGKHAIPFKKGDGCSIMIADFVCAEFGWLRGANKKSARVVMSPGKNRDGYFTSDRVVEQLQNAVEIAKEQYPDHTYVFIYDNAPSHTKRPVGSISARRMQNGPSKNFSFASTDSQGQKI